MDTKKLRQKILDLAIRGKLVPQDPNDEPASVLLERIRAEKQQLIKEGKIKAPRASKTSDKSHYRNDVPFEVPDGWALVKVRDVCVFDSGFAFSSQSYKPCGTPLIRISNISDGNISLDDCVFVEPIRDSRYVVQKGDLLIAMSGATTGKMGIYDKDYPAMLNQRVGNVKTISESVLLSGYRDLFFKSLQSQILQDAYGGAQPNISAKNICDYDLLLPPINEQVRIIKEAKTYLQLLEVVENSTAKLDDYTSRVKSRILQMAISGKLVPQDPTDEPAIDLLKRINPDFVACDNSHYPFEIPSSWAFVSGKDIFIPMRTCKPTGDEFLYIDIDSVDNKNNVIVSPKRLRTENAPSRASRFTQKGDVVFSMVRPYLKNIAVVPENHCIASTGFYVCSPNESLCSDYLYFMMLSPYVVDGLNKFMKGDNSPSINTNNILQWKYPVPPLKEQNRIVEEVQRLFSYLDKVESLLAM